MALHALDAQLGREAATAADAQQVTEFGGGRRLAGNAPVDTLPALDEELGNVADAIDGVTFGGISDLAFDSETGRYLAISDDRVEKGPARYYELELAVSFF